MGAQHQALGVLGVEALHDAAPQQPRGAHLGHFQVEVHADGPEEAQARRELVDVHALGDRGLHVFLAVGQREGQFQRLVGAGFLHVVARDADRVEARHVGRGVLHDVADDAHRRHRRVDIGVADHELLEDVVLDRSAELRLAHALLFRRHHVTGQHRQHGAVHRHGHADLGPGRSGRTGSSCPRRCRSPRRPCRRRRSRADGPSRSRGASPGRRPPTRPARPRPAPCGRTHSIPRPSKSRRTGGSSRAAPHTWWPAGRAGTARNPAGCWCAGRPWQVGGGVQRLDRDAVRRVPVQCIQIAARRGLAGCGCPRGQRIGGLAAVGCARAGGGRRGLAAHGTAPVDGLRADGITSGQIRYL